ncbi:DUF1672 family protein [Bacillus sp. KH172YL63]|uniref:DUF1672 family protein n=1 Tax=Bacillus sp. KH172YL63 TaxID=2709784 RepID=UPI0013E522C6|nr:DUF1672 family protein [Bacillus sp. KH172YL63]BCB05817.1 hypothetical protein KH172YL63_39500 [Bacillus sp. KH172YL63]
MNRKNKWIIYGIGLSLLLGGCMNMGNGVDEKKNSQNAGDQSDRLASVQEYNGEGFSLKNGQENDKIAEKNREEVEKAVKGFFLEQYKTDVEVHNIVGNVDGASVFVESIGRPNFHTYAVVPIDQKEKKILTDQVYSLEGEVENAISSGVYGLIYEDEFNELNRVLEEVIKDYPYTGESIQAINHTKSFGFGNEYYFVSLFDMELSEQIVELYLENPNTTREEYKELNLEKLSPESINITIQLFKNKKGSNPTTEELDEIAKVIENAEGLTYGAYNLLLHDNMIGEVTGSGDKDTTIERADPDYIIKK